MYDICDNNIKILIYNIDPGLNINGPYNLIYEKGPQY